MLKAVILGGVLSLFSGLGLAGAQAQQNPAPQTGGGLTDDDIRSGMDLWLSPDTALPGLLDWPGRDEGFPVFAKTALSAEGDAAAGCLVQAFVRYLDNRDKSDPATRTDSQRIALDGDRKRIELYLDLVRASARDDGMSMADMDAELEKHTNNQKLYPGMGPDQAFCDANLASFSYSIIVAEGKREQAVPQ